MNAAAEIKKLLGSLGKKTEEPVNQEVGEFAENVANSLADRVSEEIEETPTPPEELGGPSEPTRKQLEDQLTVYADMWREERAERRRLEYILEEIRVKIMTELGDITESETDD